MKRFLLATISCVLLLSTIVANAQSCPTDATAPVPGDATGASVLASTIYNSNNPLQIQLDQFGIAYLEGDSGQYVPSSGEGAQMYVPAAHSTSGSDVVFTTATDNCTANSGYPRITASRTTFYCTDIPNNPIAVTLTYSDENNNTVQDVIYVEVLDPSSPSAVAQAGTVYLDATGSVTVSNTEAVDFDGGTTSTYNNVTGYCPTSYDYSLTPSTFGCSDLGTSSVTLTVTNPTNGNSDQATTQITVLDTISPTITITNANYKVQLDASGNGLLFFADIATSSDNCLVDAETVSPSTFNCSQAGTSVLVTLQAEDASGNIKTTTVTVDVEDNVSPVLTITGSPELDAFGSVDLESASWYTVTEACNYVVSFSPSTLDCDDVANSVPVTYTVTDASGNVDQATVQVNAVDNINPTAIAADLTVSLDATGNYSITADDIDNGSSDNCEIETRTVAPSSFTCSNLGANTVTLTITDPSGNTSTATATVTVEDNMAPNTVAISGQYVVFSNQLLNGEISVTAKVLNPTSSDNCGITDTVLTMLDSNLFYKPGQLVNTFKCDDVSFTDVDGIYHDNSRDIIIHNFDASGNWSRDTANVILVDVDAPSIVVTNANVSLGADGTVDILADSYVTASDECGIDSIWLSKSEFDCSDLGVQTINAYARDIHNNSSTETLTVTVSDNTAPIINVVQTSVDIYLDASGAASLPSISGIATATDNCTNPQVVTAAPTVFTCTEVGSNTVTLTAEDDEGNIATETITAFVHDTISPTLSVDASHVLSLDASGNASLTLTDINAEASDNCGIASTTLSQTQFDCSDLGTKTVVFTAVDDYGNQSTANISVTIEDNLNPVAVVKNITIQLDPLGSASISYIDVDNGSSDNCAIVDYALSQETFDCSHIGTNNVVLTVEDAAGNTDQATAVVTVEDNVNPVLDLIASGDTIKLNQNGEKLVTVPGIIGDVSDNCTSVGDIAISVSYTNVCDNTTETGQSITLYCDDVSTLTCAQDEGNPEGLRTFVVTATDEEGNSTTESIDLFVLDLFAPDVYPKNLTLYLPSDISGNAEVVVDAGLYSGAEVGDANDPVGLDSATTDACGIATTSLLQSATQLVPDVTLTYGCSDLGDNTYFLRATDVNSNRAAYQGIVTVVDTIKPVVNTQVANVYLDASGSGVLNPEDLIASASDNIDICGLTYDASRLTFDCTDLKFSTSIVNPQSSDATNISNWDTVKVDAMATDIAGNTRTVEWAGVRVIDTVKPVLIRQVIDVDLGPNGYVDLGQVQDTILQWISDDNCSLDTSRGGLVQTYFNCSHVGLNSVSAGMYDAFGNYRSRIVTVIVHDTEAPTAIAQDITVALDATGSVTIAGIDVDNGSNDNCSIISYSVNPSSFTCDEVGGNTVTLTVEDEEGNMASATATVTVVDNIAPDLTDVDNTVTLNLDADGVAGLNLADFDVDVVEACQISSSFDIDSFDCADVATSPHTVVYSVEDASGNKSSVNIIVNVEDNVNPTAVVLASRDIYLDAQGSATLTFADIDNGSFDNCSYTATLSQSAFTCADVNTPVTVTGTLTDPSGNTDNFTTIITTRDTLGPVFASSQGDTTLIAVQHDCFAMFGAAQPSFDESDQNCPGSITWWYEFIDENGNASTISAGSPIPVGLWTVNTVASDPLGNQTIAAFTVSVIDTTLPTMQFISNPTIALGSSGQTTITPAMLENSSYDNCGIESVVIDPAVVDCDDLGAISFNVTVTDWNSNVRTYSGISATVVDNVGPTITVIPTPVTVSLDANGQASISPSDVASAIDNCTATPVLSVSPSSVDCANLGSVTVTITATDDSGNTTVATKAVTVVDNISPTISVSDVTLNLTSNGVVSLPINTASAADNCSTPSLQYSAENFTCSDLGDNVVTVTSLDASGNQSVETFVVTIVDAISPMITTVGTAPIFALDAFGQVSITPSNVVASYSDNCSVASVSVAPSSFDCSDLGLVPVTVTVEDVNGNVSTAVQNVVITDAMAPSIVTVSGAVTAWLDNSGSASISTSDVVASTADNCSVASITLSQSSFDCGELGSNTITITVTDGNGNSSTATKAVVIRDSISPAITAPAAVTLSIGSSGSVTLPGNTASATDNCGSPTITYSETSFSCSDIGTNNVVVTATDANGNSSTDIIVVTVQDVINPSLSLTPASITIGLDANGSASLSTSQIVTSVTDNCSGVSVTVSPATFGCSDLGSNTVTVTATDASGNTTTATKTITVVDLIDPIISVVSNPSDVVLDATGSATIMPSMVVSSVTDNCTTSPTVTVTPTSVDCSDLGVVTVTVIAVDGSGNASTTTVPVNVVDNDAPIIVAAPADTTLPECDAVFNYSFNVTDNCNYTATLTSGLASGAMFPVGVTTVEWVFTDASGNSVTHSFDVTVDSLGTYTLPIKDEFCFDNGPVDLQNGQSGLVFSGAGVTASGDVFQPAQAGIGTHTLSYIFTDANGCEQIGTWVAIVRPTPQQPTVLQITPTTLSSSEVGASYKWYRNGVRLVGETNQDLFVTQGGNYQVEVYNIYGCNRLSTGFVISSTGLSVEELLKNVDIYPNPTTSSVSIEFSYAIDSEMNVVVVDMLGRSLYQANISKGDLSHTIDMSSMTSGTYQLIIRDVETGNSTIERIIKVD